MPSRFTDEREITGAVNLTPIQRDQLRAAGKLYDGEELDAAARLVNDPHDERSFLGFCNLWRVVDGTEDRYDAWLYQVDSGTIFRAGTTEVAAEIIQFGLETRDPAVRAELGPALVEAGLLPKSDLSYPEFAELLRAQQSA
ncbi:hypothetical protein KZZ52_11710 [Dactylosporangium sp. AC04546]|uniref:hypothetical protein n=1 Tax=Dactylosporangium sp. AC04546 TaxID=2862460 RepID=UPI001EDE20F7|nr:hypothetical protein [Dactylosporangium sp. AC04546]WVK86013.1 hypothetical protein KZZ52_11710 [Dactylosporangium sp. AC04546]